MRGQPGQHGGGRVLRKVKILRGLVKYILCAAYIVGQRGGLAVKFQRQNDGLVLALLGVLGVNVKTADGFHTVARKIQAQRALLPRGKNIHHTAAHGVLARDFGVVLPCVSAVLQNVQQVAAAQYGPAGHGERVGAEIFRRGQGGCPVRILCGDGKRPFAVNQCMQGGHLAGFLLRKRNQVEGIVRYKFFQRVNK